MKKIAVFVFALFVIAIFTVIFLGTQSEIREVHFSEQKEKKNKICSDIEFVKSKFPNIKEIKSVSYIYEKESGDREVGLEKIYFEGIINVGNGFSEEIEKEFDWEKCDKPLDLLIETKDTFYFYSDEFEEKYISDSFVGTFYFAPNYKQLIFRGEY